MALPRGWLGRGTLSPLQEGKCESRGKTHWAPTLLDLPAAPVWHPCCISIYTTCIYTTCIYTTQDQCCIHALVMNGTTASLGHLHRVSDLTSSNKPANEVFSRHPLSIHKGNFM